MSIKVYTGRMGSGKTYEVVSEVILGALRRGRRVVSNVAGLDPEAMRAVLAAEGLAPERIGELVQVDHEAVMRPDFWRSDKTGFLASLGVVQPVPVDSFIQPGDLVALDEVWRFWEGFGKVDSDGKKRPDSVMNFFRMHRHFIHAETGVACDVALITQDIMDISRQVRAVVEETYYMEKLTAVGLSKRYRVDIFQGGKKTGKPLRSVQRSYNEKYFPLYASHSQKTEGGAAAVEENIDGRGNVLHGLMFKVILPLSIPLLVFAIWTLYGFFNPKPKAANPDNAAPSQAFAAQGSGPNATAPAKAAVVADAWKIVGWYEVAGVIRLILTDGKTTRYMVAPEALKLTALTVEARLPDGSFVTNWGGVVARSGDRHE